jgi:hypothetical protein
MTIKRLLIGILFYVLGMTLAYMLDRDIPSPVPPAMCTTDTDCMQKFPGVYPY